MAERSTAAEDALPFVAPCRRLPLWAAVGWLRKGLDDMRAAPALSLSYGLVTAVVSLVMGLVAYRFGSYWLLLAALSGLLFIGPILCLGLYAVSAQLERGEKPALTVSLREAGVRHLGTEMVFALILLVVFLVWLRAGSMVHVFFPVEADPEIADLVAYLGVGSVVGAFFAVITFATSTFSLPMLMHRDVDAVTAVVTSINAVLRNKRAMLVWGSLIVAGLAIGFATAFIGLIFTFPLLGHATWHGYEETIDASAFPRHREGVTARPGPHDSDYEI
ncbi:MAG: DUF2189 domain-containing protein [Myxococcota bacterium]|nr:DUF2189 domain-containing protein [Myxococcota bacterium]